MNSFLLHILAMGCMLLDHLWATIVPGNMWMTYAGRLAFPIFAFLITEGFRHTHNLKKYVIRLFLLALVSEIPFNLMYGGNVFYPFHQNVIWTYLIGIGCMYFMEKVKHKRKLWLTCLSAIGITVFGYLLGMITMVDYYGYGVLMILAFYFFYGRKPWQIAGLLLSMTVINGYLMAGLTIPFTLFDHTFLIPQQATALLALIPVFLYNGKHGYYNKHVRALYYWFYPVHILILALIWLYL